MPAPTTDFQPPRHLHPSPSELLLFSTQASLAKPKARPMIGSTLKGVGPTYMDKTGRNGLRVVNES